MKYLGSIDVGGTKTVVGIIDLEGNILVKRHFSTLTADCYEHYANCYAHFCECLDHLGLTTNHLKGIGINMPGMVDAATGILIQAPFAKWYNIDVKGYFSQRLQTANIFVENDVNSCAVGELVFGNACDNFLWVTVSTGIGGAFVTDGKLIRGFNSCAGELGHVKVEYEHPAQCCCNQWGCAEAHGSGTAITRMFGEKVQADKDLSATLATRGMPIDAKSCAVLAGEGNMAAIEVYNNAGRYIGRALSYAANLVNPHKIYMGGGVSDSLELLLPTLREEFERATVQQNADIEIRKTALAYNAALIGAAALALKNGG